MRFHTHDQESEADLVENVQGSEIQALGVPVNQPGPDRRRAPTGSKPRRRSGSDPLTQNLKYIGHVIGVLNGFEHNSLQRYAWLRESRHVDSSFPMKLLGSTGGSKQL